MKKQAVRRESKPDPAVTQGLTNIVDDPIAKTSNSAAADTVTSHEQSYAGLLPLLTRLDRRLAAAVEAAERLFAARAGGDLYRGLAISPADVAAALGRTPGEPFPPLSLQGYEIAEATHSLSLRRLLWLQRVYGLTDFDLDVILIGLAPELDLRYERIYAYLHDDISRRRPSIDLALNLLCVSAGQKLQQRERFAPDAPLVRNRVIDIFADPHHVNPPLLSRHYRVDEQIVRLLLLEDSLDSRLAAFCEMAAPLPSDERAPLAESMEQELHAVASVHAQSPVRLYFHGPSYCGQVEAVGLLATVLDIRVLNADLHRLGADAASTRDSTFTVLVREAWFRGALLYLRGIDKAAESLLPNQWNVLWRALKDLPVHFVFEGKQAWIPSADKPPGVVTRAFAYPDLAQRTQWWRQCLRQHKLEMEEESLIRLAQRYRMTNAQIQDAAAVAASSAGKSQAQALFAAARAQCGHDLAVLATKIKPHATWDDLVLPADETAQLREVCDRFNYRDKVLNEWGFAKKLSYGLGITALFSGGSGTGKTMAAEVMANALGLDLYRIDLAQVVSKYIGETEKNLDKVFTAATNANAILFFDEADALFGKRSEVKDSHDRYANLEISYLLQKMEQYEGIAILATNLSDNLDQAFTRRLAFSIHFPFPDEAARLQLWTRAWPEAVPIATSVDRNLLAREVKLAGGNIKNIAVTAAFKAAGNGGVVDMAHMSESVRRESQKNGLAHVSVASVWAR
ncbi:ATP-binding protein [Candidatus Nitrospira nitrificans]|uniref:ATPase, AAA family protein n=1 Tax=Candidatus Nitrospira nitrificans TaxID=1742973 RepID=A0A0S4L9X8_9BACT|nr:ATP-binding protein [Candidatus Nitrospira nitrificans]CUS33999.1 ATPase, AAA family protein [Candidatus Nitrospira nitrificans]